MTREEIIEAIECEAAVAFGNEVTHLFPEDDTRSTKRRWREITTYIIARYISRDTTAQAVIEAARKYAVEFHKLRHATDSRPYCEARSVFIETLAAYDAAHDRAQAAKTPELCRCLTKVAEGG